MSRHTAVCVLVCVAAVAQTITIATNSPLPPVSVGSPYSQALVATGGVAPYTWSVLSGAPPAGLTLNSEGLLAGIPLAVGTTEFLVAVTDARNARATKSFVIAIAPSPPNLTIATMARLPDGSAGTPYAQSLTAVGGTPPYSWSLTNGSLPKGLSLNSANGTISGTPTDSGTFDFGVRVSDMLLATADRHFTVVVVLPAPMPTVTIAGVPATAGSAVQVPFDVTLSFPYTKPVSGQVALAFQPGATVSRDDPAIQFASGGRAVNFSIPEGGTHAVFGAAPMAFQTGTVAGTITLAATSDLPGGSDSTSMSVSRGAPVIRSATIVPNGSGFQVQVAGYSNSRDLAGASFSFTARPGQVVGTGDLKVDLSTPAGQWYSAAASTTYGGQFLLLVPFIVQQGAASGLASVTVQVQNAQALSTPAIANF